MPETKPPASASKKSICVFCGSNPGNNARYMTLAERTGIAISDRNYRLVYGGGGFGLMGSVARAANNNGGDVLGIIPEFLIEAEGAFLDVPHRIVPDMHVRKMQMYEQADAFIVLPGGIGTLEEAVEIISWMRLQLHQKPIIFVSTDNYWTRLIDLIKHTIAMDFTPSWLIDDIFETDGPNPALDIIEYKWENPGEVRPLRTLPEQV